MTIAIVGSRIFDDYDLLKSVMQPFLSKAQQIVSGGAEGADKLGEKWSYDFLNQPPIIIRPQWRELNHPDALIKKDKNGQKIKSTNFGNRVCRTRSCRCV